MHRQEERTLPSPRSDETVHDVVPSEAEQCAQNQKLEAIARMARTVAHDLNNQLCAIMMYAELVQSRVVPGKPEHQWVEEIKKLGGHSKTLMQQLLDFCRQGDLQGQTVDCDDVVADAGGERQPLPPRCSR
jgi:signal transduction histidine kinase